MKKILVIRFSSFGDIIQSLAAATKLKERYPDAEIHWVTRSDFADVVSLCPHVNKVWKYEKREGLLGLLLLKNRLVREKFDLIYDAHSNIRSRILCFYLAPLWRRLFSFLRPDYAIRSKERLKRIMLFRFRKDLYPMPFKGMLSYVRPLVKFGVSLEGSLSFQAQFDKGAVEKVKSILDEVGGEDNRELPLISLVPSAAWEMKRWPVDYWKKLVEILPEFRFAILGGPSDTFCSEIESVDPSRVTSLAGKLSMMESCIVVDSADITVSGDTGILHVADILGKRGIALIGPTAFGFPTSEKIEVVDIPLECRPCTKDGRGKCTQDLYKRCLMEITPELVAERVRGL